MANREYFEEISKQSAQQQRSISTELRKCFGGDAHVHHACRSFTPAELKIMNTGVAQRGDAIRRFLIDHLSGKKKYLKHKIVPASVAKRVFSRNPSPDADSVRFAQQLQFFYGPDIIRDAKGNFCVLEDNAGYVGGFGDLNAFRRAGEIIKGAKPEKRSDPFYSKMSSFFRDQAKLYGGKKILLLSYPRMHRENREDHRLAEILTSFGINEITSTRALKIKGEHLYHRGERVSFLITNSLLRDIEPLSPNAKINFFPSSVPGFWNAFRKGGFGLSCHPAAECVSDKEFYLYVEKMIRFYLKAKPILSNLQSLSLATAKNRNKVFANLDQWVVKSAIGHGGSKVWIGKTLSRQRAKQLQKRVEANPTDFIVQVFTELSRLDGYSVDARPLSIISPTQALVSNLPWGRGALATKPRKVNLCSGGLFVISEVSTKRL